MKRQRPTIAIVIFIAAVTPLHAATWWTLPPSGTEAKCFDSGTFKPTAGKSLGIDHAAPGPKALTAPKDGLTLESGISYTGPQELRARVRLRTTAAPSASAMFRLARTGRPETEILVNIVSAKINDNVRWHVYHGGKPLFDPAEKPAQQDWDRPVSFYGDYLLRAYPNISPGWPEDFRARVEHDMAALPDHNAKWLDVRIELKKGNVRLWLDDRLAIQKSDPAISDEGSVQVSLSDGAQLAGCRMTKLQETSDRFLPVRLGGYANGRSLMDGASTAPASLPPADAPALVQGIPFVFPGVNSEGNDHLDIGKSLYRQANDEGYSESLGVIWGGSAWRDPARIQIRLPNGQFDRLYVVAASDDKPDALPVLTAMFFRPDAGFAEDFEGKIPLATAQSASAISLPVVLSDGRRANLWLVEIPLDPGRLSSLADLDIVEVELTKKVYPYRSYPDPIRRGWHQGGLPSAAHVYALTLGKAPVGFDWQPTQFGHVWTAPAAPGYTATLSNHTATTQQGKLVVATRSYDGSEESRQEQSVSLVANATGKLAFSLPVKLSGYHDITATLQIAGKTWTEKRSFVRLAPDARAPRWTEGKGAMFGFWSYCGGHYTPKADHIIHLMTAAGARAAESPCGFDNADVQRHWARAQAGPWEVAPQPWAAKDPYDPKEYAAYKKTVIETYTKWFAAIPEPFRPDHVYFFAEPSISNRLSAGNWPEYWQGEPFQLTAEEKERLRMYFVTAKCAAEAIREKWPHLKILIPYGDPLSLVALLRAGFPKNLIDGCGLDICGFERLPEQQLHQVSIHRLYELRAEFAKAGVPNPRLQTCEGIFVPTEPTCGSWREQMDIYNRWTLLCMAYGVSRFYSGWFAFDCGSYYGAEQYGGCGIQRRIPYCDPKPAYAAFATMTDKLDQANFDGWLKTGSLSTYCLRFNGPKGLVYALWTIRGRRPVTLTLAADADVSVTDAMNNTKVLKSENKKVALVSDPSVIYVTSAGTISGVRVGEPDNSDAKPAADARLIADLGDGSWHYTSQCDLTYENNNFDTFRYPGHFSASLADDPKLGTVLASKLDKQGQVHELMPWYNTLTPKRPIALRGAPANIGLWTKGASDWGRVVYCLRDSSGQRWTSVGTKDQWNCDDVRSASSFNFDGWRYLRFELPGHAGYDSFRKHGTTWWGSTGGDGVVHLPLVLENIIVEQRSHILYVNDVQPVASDAVSFGKLYVEYASPADATEEAVRLSRLRMPLPQGAAELPNPIAEMAREGVGAPVAIAKFEPPLDRDDGTTVHVQFQETPAAKTYSIWCSAHADGRGAVNMTPGGAKSGALVAGLRPAIKLYFWVTYNDAAGKTSKPSPAAEIVLVDKFKEK